MALSRRALTQRKIPSDPQDAPSNSLLFSSFFSSSLPDGLLPTAPGSRHCVCGGSGGGNSGGGGGGVCVRAVCV